MAKSLLGRNGCSERKKEIKFGSGRQWGGPWERKKSDG